jgi:hypothetical protein
MELEGTWSKDIEGFITFNPSELHRFYEEIIGRYHHIYNDLLEQYQEDEELASEKAREKGYKMVTDYKTILGKEEFVTFYEIPGWQMDLWYEKDELTGKRIYEKGFVRIRKG